MNNDSTINATGVSDILQIKLTGGSVTIADTTTGTATTFSDGDLASSSFSNFVEFCGNDADNVAGGSVGLNAQGYIGGDGDDIIITSALTSFANGAPTESLFMGDYQIARDPEMFAELLTIFPELADHSQPTDKLAHAPLRGLEASALRHTPADV